MKIDYNEPIKFIGNSYVNIDYHDGQLNHAIGVNSVQVLRANRENPDKAEGTGWTYNHAPMLAFHNGKFYLEYLSNPVEEHKPPGQTLLSISKDGLHWSKPKIIFPVYKIPDGIFEYDGGKLPDNTYAVMHQRMGFYLAPNGKFLVLGNYGISPTVDQVPFGKFSIGRVVREIYPDDTFGPIYFIRYNVNTIWNESNTHYPFYTKSQDKDFIIACDLLLSNPLVTQQWAEEQGDEDDLITVKSKGNSAYYNKAFCWYKLKDGSIIGLWKWMKCAVSHDNGRTWSEVTEIPTIKHSGAKIWGQKTPDDRYALIYNPHTNNVCRWPLAIITSDDGILFDNMLCVIGDLTPKRYAGGNFKNCGFNYVRGIETNEGMGPDNAVYVAFSVNKEDIWISRIPTPVIAKTEEDIHEDFSNMQEDAWVKDWNIYSPKWAPVSISKSPDGSGKCLKLEDFDRYDYAKAERIFKEGKFVELHVKLMTLHGENGDLYIELCDGKDLQAFKIIFNCKKEIEIVHGRKKLVAMHYENNVWYDIEIVADAAKSVFDVIINGKSLSAEQIYQGQGSSMKGWYFFRPANTLEKLVFRTGAVRRNPSPDTIWGVGQDLPEAGVKCPSVTYFVKSVDIVTK